MPARKKLVVSRDRLLSKVAECRYFLQHMEQHQGNPNEFGFGLSAFLCAFKSVASLTPQIYPDPKRQKQFRNGINQLRDGHPDLNYLLNARDAEVHREGVKIVLVLNSFLKPRQKGFTFPSSRFTVGFVEGSSLAFNLRSGRRSIDQLTCTATAGCFRTTQTLSSMSAGIVSSY